MRNIKVLKIVRLSIIAVFMSIGLTFLSCSPDSVDEVADCDCGTVISKYTVSMSYGSEILKYIRIESECEESGYKNILVESWEYDSVSIGDYHCK